jgi:CRP-like cAMP-binding protein
MLQSPSHNSGSDLRQRTVYDRLSALAELREAESDLLLRVGSADTIQWAARTLIEQPLDEYSSTRYIISGWAAQVRELRDGRRQVVKLLLPGDPLSPLLQVCQALDILCIDNVQTVDGGLIRAAAQDPQRFPGIVAAVELEAARDRTLLTEQVIRLGQQTAYERMANLFVELHCRCSSVSLVHGDSFAFPLTQETLGDLLGLSVVHVNRTLQRMRKQSLIRLKQGRLALLKLPELLGIAQFNPPPAKSSRSYCSAALAW